MAIAATIIGRVCCTAHTTFYVGDRGKQRGFVAPH